MSTNDPLLHCTLQCDRLQKTVAQLRKENLRLLNEFVESVIVQTKRIRELEAELLKIHDEKQK